MTGTIDKILQTSLGKKERSKFVQEEIDFLINETINLNNKNGLKNSYFLPLYFGGKEESFYILKEYQFNQRGNC